MEHATFEGRTRGPETADEHDEGLTVVLAHRRSGAERDIREALEDDGFVVLDEAADASELVAKVVDYKPQICLLDVDLPGGSIQAIEAIVAERPGTMIAVLTDSTARERVRRALRAGGDGVVLRQTPPEDVPAAVRALLEGRPLLPQAPIKSVDEELQDLARARGVASPRTVSSKLLYVPRFSRHFGRRLRSRMPLPEVWASTRERMRTYR
jgi:DNA-binding NarL/FixJ family response regulator